ncbi:MAG TPA: hypothetical protein VGR20_22855 [Acidimicrobiia bacterium]|nr:hypothetical protein [Acidimicrobiia bacterium]
MPSHRCAVTAVLAAGALLLGACDSGSKSSSNGAAETTSSSSPSVTAPSALSSSTTAGVALGPPCTTVTAALVSEKLGYALVGPNVDRGPAAMICTYDNPAKQSESATVQFSYQATSESYAKSRTGFSSHGEQVTDVAGLGDEAFSATLSVANITNTTLVARKGGNEVLITTTAPADKVPVLMKAILALI